jgi:hypothetical protein
MALDGANPPKGAAPPANDDRRQPKSAPPSGTAEDRTVLNGGAASSESEASPHDPNDGAEAAAAAEKKDSDPTQVATVREVFSFAKTTRVKVCIVLSFIMAAVSGCVLPGTAWILLDRVGLETRLGRGARYLVVL